MALQVSQLFIYPVKSLAGIAMQETKVEKKGLQYDRRWMLADSNMKHMTQRKFKKMALLQPHIEGVMMHIRHKHDESIQFSFNMTDHLSEELTVTVWDQPCMAHEVSKEASAWFSENLGASSQLVYMPDNSVRPTDPDYSADADDQVSFADGYPLLILDQASLDLISERSGQHIPVDRFRPNVVITGGHAHIEDELKRLSIGELDFHGAKPCTRCIMTTIDQETGQGGQEPLKTLATYRSLGNKIQFGMNLIPMDLGSIRVGDALTVKETTEPIAF